jgi:3-O-methylgallate 3,4-dioxygenase
MKSLKGEQFEGHAYSFIPRRFMPDGPIPIVPIMLNTYYPPNQPSPRVASISARRFVG